MADLANRIQNAADQLCRYGGEPISNVFCDLLDVIADINDDISHLRDLNVVIENAEKAKHLLDFIVSDYRIAKEG